MATYHHAALETLFHPFAEGRLAVPEGRVLFVNARVHPQAGAFGQPDCIQPFYPDAIRLENRIEAPRPPYAAAMILAPKDRLAAQHDLAAALGALDQGGLLLAAAANDANGNRLEGWFRDMGLTPESASKNKCRAVWAYTDGQKAPASWIENGRARDLTLGGEIFTTRPGLFGWDKIDAGSALLAAHLPSDLKGQGADFGCGYGYLARRVLEREQVAALTVIDADRRAVDCCVKNNSRALGLWADLTQPLAAGPFDFIVMNPPFHLGKKTDSDIGAAFIATAAGALKKNGRLYMVANRQLPYEAVLKRHFTAIEQIADAAGFKVLFATRA